MTIRQMTIRRQLPSDLHIQTWNVQGMGEVSKGTVVGSEILSNLTELGDYDFFLVQEHKQ